MTIDRKAAFAEFSAQQHEVSQRLSANKDLIEIFAKQQKAVQFESAAWWALQSAIEGVGAASKSLMVQLESDRKMLESELGEPMFPSDGGDI